MKRVLIALLIALPSVASAEITPPKGPHDPRVRVVDYNPLNVVKLATFFGVSTHVQFAPNETIQDVAVGDDRAWKIAPRGGHLFIKPLAEKADTNVTVVTDKRSYQFALVVQPRAQKDASAWADPNLIFSLSFRYPDEEAAQAVSAARKEAAKAQAEEIKSRLADAARESLNFDYWVAGSDEITPTSARDDGRFIYLTFSNNRDMPAVYSVDDSGSESLVNTSVLDGNTIVVQRLVRRLMLRKGSAVVSVENKSFRSAGGLDNSTGTIAADVERVIKGAQ